MSTRSLTIFNDDQIELAVLYRHGDGYPEGHGADLKDAFGACVIVNGINSAERHKVANGMDCLAAQVVAHFKRAPGNVYLMRAGARDVGEEFIYTLYCPDETGPLHLKLQGGVKTRFGSPGTKQHNMPVLFDGPVSEFDPQAAAKEYQRLYDSIPNDHLESGRAKQSKTASKNGGTE